MHGFIHACTGVYICIYTHIVVWFFLFTDYWGMCLLVCFSSHMSAEKSETEAIRTLMALIPKPKP